MVETKQKDPSLAFEAWEQQRLAAARKRDAIEKQAKLDNDVGPDKSKFAPTNIPLPELITQMDPDLALTEYVLNQLPKETITPKKPESGYDYSYCPSEGSEDQGINTLQGYDPGRRFAGIDPENRKQHHAFQKGFV